MTEATPPPKSTDPLATAHLDGYRAAVVEVEGEDGPRYALKLLLVAGGDTIAEQEIYSCPARAEYDGMVQRGLALAEAVARYMNLSLPGTNHGTRLDIVWKACNDLMTGFERLPEAASPGLVHVYSCGDRDHVFRVEDPGPGGKPFLRVVEGEFAEPLDRHEFDALVEMGPEDDPLYMLPPGDDEDDEEE